jgi:hypothetical protein
MGVRTRGLGIKAGAAKLKADRAARAEAEAVTDRWNRRLATGRDAVVAHHQGRADRRKRHGSTSSARAAALRAIDLRTLDRHPLASESGSN